MDPTQDKSEPSLTFLHRTDKLASRLGLGVKALPEHLGISHGTLFSGRRADSTVTAKTWGKLEAAEMAAGVRYKTGTSCTVQEEALEQSLRYQNNSDGNLEKTIAAQAARLDALEQQVRILTYALGSLLPSVIEPSEERLKKSS